jgi:hypothetical protein
MLFDKRRSKPKQTDRDDLLVQPLKAVFLKIQKI